MHLLIEIIGVPVIAAAVLVSVIALYGITPAAPDPEEESAMRKARPMILAAALVAALWVSAGVITGLTNPATQAESLAPFPISARQVSIPGPVIPLANRRLGRESGLHLR